MTKNIIFPDDISDEDREDLTAQIDLLYVVDVDINVERETGVLYDLLPMAVYRITSIEERPSTMTTIPTGTPIHEALDDLEAQMKMPDAERLDGATLTGSEMRAAGGIVAVMEGIEFEDHFEHFGPTEVILRHKDTGDLVGSVVQLDDGSWVYNKDAS